MPKGGCMGDDMWVDDHETDRCPVMYYSEYAPIFSSYNAYKDGFLPISGGYLEQPANLMDCIDIVKGEYNKMERAIAKQQ